MADSIPMPSAMTEEAVAAWCREVCCLNVQRIPASELRAWEHSAGKEGWRIVARAVLAWTEAKVREAVRATDPQGAMLQDEIVARVMGKEAPRG